MTAGEERGLTEVVTRLDNCSRCYNWNKPYSKSKIVVVNILVTNIQSQICCYQQLLISVKELANYEVENKYTFTDLLL